MAERRKALSSKDKLWPDAKGLAIPFTRVEPLEKLREKNATAILNEALVIEEALTAFRELVVRMHSEVFLANAKRYDVDLSKTKGNHTWHNFDRSIRIEADMKDTIRLDDTLVAAAHAKLKELLGNSITSDVEFLPELIGSAFETAGGKLDTRKVLDLLSYRHKVKSKLFQEACSLIEQAMYVHGSKQYFTVAVRQEDGSYRTLNLNFSK